MVPGRRIFQGAPLRAETGMTCFKAFNCRLSLGGLSSFRVRRMGTRVLFVGGCHRLVRFKAFCELGDPFRKGRAV